MGELQRQTNERIYAAALGLLPFVMTLFLACVTLHREVPAGLATAARPYLLGSFFFGVLQILSTFILIVAFLQISDMRGVLPKATLLLFGAMLFFPLIVFYMVLT